MPILNLKKGKIELKNKDEVAQLVIYGEITSDKWGDNEVEPKEIKDILDEIGEKDVNIYINSPGGSVFAGVAIYNMLKRHKGHKKVYVEGYAASIASVIAMAGDEIIVPKNAYLMIHKAWGFCVGNADDLREQADLYERMDSTIVGIYMEKVKEGVTEAKLSELMKAETWLNGSEAQEYFNVTLGEENKIAACLDGDLYKNYKLPENLKIERVEDKKAQEELENIKAKLRLSINI